MFRRVLIALLLAMSLLSWVACKNQKAANPLAHVNSKQPDKVLYDRAMEAMNKHQYDTARLTLQTLINAYPDSEYVARAKLAVGESWYQEGTPAGLTQAETEFRDFITFFPNMPEAAEAQLKIADIHYRQMGKPDRDYTHARRAQDEYRQLLIQYPDNKKLDEVARQRLLEVQEVLAERQYRIARFYYLRGSLLAAIARDKTLTDTYPLYSQADDALYMLGQAYEQQAERTRLSNLPDAPKQRLIKEYTDDTAAAYTKIVTRYPAMPRYQDARRRLAAMNRPVPEPTPDAIALNKKELASRAPTTTYEHFVINMGRKPDLSEATHVGVPSLSDPKETDAPMLAREIDSAVKSEMNAKSGAPKVSVETVSANAAVPENQPAPHSEQAAVKPGDVPAEAPSQLNESASSSSSDTAANSASSSLAANTKDDPDKDASSSRKAKKKHHFHIPLPL